MECLASEFESQRKNEKVKSFQGHLKRKKKSDGYTTNKT